jgi:hypothetical protein
MLLSVECPQAEIKVRVAWERVERREHGPNGKKTAVVR